VQVVKRRSGRDRERGHLKSRTHHATKDLVQVVTKHDDLTAYFSIAAVNARSDKGK